MGLFDLLRQKVCSIIVILFLITQTIFSANIIFDLEGVLVQKSNFSAAWQIGLQNFLGIYNPFTIEKTLYKFLDSLEPRKTETPLAMHNNLVLPQLLCDWLSGNKTNEELKTLTTQKIKEEKDFFTSKSQRRIIRETLNFMFDPERMSKTISPIKKGTKLLKKCYQKLDDTGNRRHNIYIISNWDTESFKTLIDTNKKIQKIIDMCEGTIISGQIHLLKPDPAIFNYLFDTYHINPDKDLTVFIDDQKVNIQAAQNLNYKNLHTIHCKNYNFKQVKKELYSLGIL